MDYNKSSDVPPPTKAEIAIHAKAWNGLPHRDVCVKMRDGIVVVHTGLNTWPTFNTYGSEATAFRSVPDEHGDITITSEGGPPYTGPVCLGYISTTN